MTIGTGPLPRKGASVWLCVLTDGPSSALLSKSSSKSLIVKSLSFEGCLSLLRAKFRNVQISVGIAVEEIVALLLFPVVIKILVFYHTSRPQLDSWYLPCIAQVLLQYCTCGSWVDEDSRQPCSYMMHNNLAHSSARVQFLNQT